MNREQIFAYAKETYGTEPEYLWKRSPESAVLRHTGNRKWYGIVMNVSKNVLGIQEEGYVDVLNVKCEPDMIGFIRMQKGILPGYHMNKNSWISILLDGTVPSDMIETLLNSSYELISGKRQKGKVINEQ